MSLFGRSKSDLFINSIRDENVEEAKKWLEERGIDANFKDGNGFFALDYAVFSENEVLVKLLIEHKAEVNPELISLAVLKGNIDIVKLLIENGADVNLKGTGGRTALQEAAFFGRHEIVELLIQNQADFRLKDHNGNSALDEAIAHGHDLAASVLINHASDALIDFNDHDEYILIGMLFHGAMFNSATQMIRNPKIRNGIVKYLLDEHLEETKYSLLWHACKDGHVECVKALMEIYPDLISVNAPDGTSPHFMAYIRGNLGVLQCLKEDFNVVLEYEEVICDEKDSFMIQLTKNYPLFNENVEKKFVYKVPLKIDISNLDEHILGDFCVFRQSWIRAFTRGKKQQAIQYVKDVIPKSCKLTCSKRVECSKVRDVIMTMQCIETELAQRIPNLEPKFILVGSIIEGTRIHSAMELDITVQFNGLEKYPLLLKDDPFTLSSVEENHLLYEWSNEGVFQYEKFLAFFLSALQEIISKTKEKFSNLTEKRISVGKLPSTCKFGCPRKENEFYTHCEECIFTVTQTKCGACLVFKWKDENFTVDLIPVLPVKGKNFNQMINLITETLFRDRPPNWLAHLRTFIKRDRVLPESFLEVLEGNPEKPIQVAIKLLHFGTKRNFIIRPAQQLAVTKEFKENQRLKRVYCQIKCLKSLLGVNVNSYFIKKVLLTDVMKTKFNVEVDMYFLYEALHHSELKIKFESIIDYAKWQRIGYDIPILKC